MEKQNDQTASPAAMAASASVSASSYTLNGIPYDDANTMVLRFLNNKGTYQHTPTCVWFSKAAFDQMYATIIDPIYDGMRLYFARNIPFNQYTVVVVSTLNGGPDPDDPTINVHQDYFQYSAPGQLGEEYYGRLGEVTPQQGALLYTPSSLPPICPAGPDNCPGTDHYITCETAYQMVNYIGPDEVNTISEWFDKGVIKGLIDVTPYNGGIRVYFARRLSMTRHGFIFVITKPDAFGIQQDFFTCIPFVPYYKKFVGGGGDDNGEQCPPNCRGKLLGG